MLLFKGENGMSENHTSTYDVIVIKYTDSLYIGYVKEGRISFVKERRKALEFLETDKEYIKSHVEQIIEHGFNKDSIFIVKESEMVVKKEIEMTVDSFIGEPKIDLSTVRQDVWERM